MYIGDPTANGQKTTPDIGLSFALWLNKMRKSVFRKLLFRQSDLQKISIWDLGESGSFFHHYLNQHERYQYTSEARPASHRSQIVFFDESELPLHRPKNVFINRSSNYPLRGSDRLETCSRCRGSGKITVTINKQTRRVTCPTCEGEKILVVYKIKKYTWKHTVDQEPILSPIINRRALRRLVRKTHKKGGSYPIEQFSSEEILDNAGVYNPRIQALIEHARQEAAIKEEEIRNRYGKLLYQRRERYYVPLGFVNLFIGKRFSQYFVAGNLSHRSINNPTVSWSRLKFLGWLATATATAIITVVLRLSIPLTPGAMHLYLLLISLAIMGLGLLRFIRDFFVKFPQTWFISDNDGLGGWLFVHLVAQTISLKKKGKLLDLSYTDLFQIPEPDTRRARNSFFCSVEIGKDKESQVTELFWAGQRAIALFQDEVKAITNDIQTFVWVIRQPHTAKIDRFIANMIEAKRPKQQKKIRIILLIDLTDSIVSIADFPKTQAYLAPEQITLQSLPLLKAVRDLQQGQLSPQTQKTLDCLVEILQPAAKLSIDSQTVSPIVALPNKE